MTIISLYFEGETCERNARLIEQARFGARHQDLALQYGISRERVSQICKRAALPAQFKVDRRPATVCRGATAAGDVTLTVNKLLDFHVYPPVSTKRKREIERVALLAMLLKPGRTLDDLCIERRVYELAGVEERLPEIYNGIFLNLRPLHLVDVPDFVPMSIPLARSLLKICNVIADGR